MNVQNPEKKSRVLCLGNSVLMESVRDCLSAKQNLEVIRMGYTPLKTAKSIAASQPDMIIFELDDPHSYPMLSFVKDQSDVLYLGLDLTSCRAIVLNTHQRLTRTMDELSKAVEEELSRKFAERKEVKNSDTLIFQ